MDSIQNLIEKASQRSRNILFDTQIKNLGQLTTAIRVKVTENKYGDETSSSIYTDNIECIINYPGDGVPLDRFRKDNSSARVESTSIYLLDILPIQIYCKNSDLVEARDYLIQRVPDDQGNFIIIPIQITQTVGTIRSTLLWKKYDAALANTIPDEVSKVIDMIDLRQK